MKLSILIPTYNRAEFLIKNLHLLLDYIIESKNTDDVEIVISNNCSPDNTDDLVNTFIKDNPSIKINYISNKENIGLEKNALNVLSHAIGEYVMYLGDDDYISFDYFLRCVNLINTKKNIGNIIPSYTAVDIQENPIGFGRDLKTPSSYWKSGFNNCWRNSWRGHQLSGLVIKREGLLDAYLEKNVNNIYLFIFFTAYSCLKGDTYHVTEFPVKVTQPGQEKKDWNYGKDGLINQLFDNYKKLPLNNLQKSFLQLYLDSQLERPKKLKSNSILLPERIACQCAMSNYTPLPAPEI